MPMYNLDGTVREMKFQSEEYQKPVYDRPPSRPFATGTGTRHDPEPGGKPKQAKKVTVAGVEPRKPVRAKAEPKTRQPSKKELNKLRDQKIVELMKGGATAQQAGDAVGLSKQRTLQIFRQNCPDYALPPGGNRAKDTRQWYGAWEVLEETRYYRQPDGNMTPGPATGTPYLKCRCDCRYQSFSFVSISRLTQGQSKSCVHCAASRHRQPGPLTPAELALARSLAPRH